MSIRLRLGIGVYPWSVLITLVLGVTIPTLCILWFMTETIENTEFASQKKVETLIKANLEGVKASLTATYEQKQQQLNLIEREYLAQDQSKPIGILFSNAVEQVGLDGLYILEDDRVHFPKLTRLNVVFELPGMWRQAESAEFLKKDLLLAKNSYLAIHQQSTQIDEQALALLAAARVHLKEQKDQQSLAILLDTLQQEQYRSAKDRNGGLVHIGALFLALDVLGKTNPKTEAQQLKYDQIRNDLFTVLLDYSSNNISSSQRLNGIKKILKPGEESLIVKAEAQSLKYLYFVENQARGNAFSEGGRSLPVKSESQQTVAFLRITEKRHLISLIVLTSIEKELSRITKNVYFPEGVSLLLKHESNITDFDDQVSIALGDIFPGYHLVLNRNLDALLQAEELDQTASYVWIGMLIVFLLCVLAAITAYVIGAKLKNSQLKNDFLATVTHELKTPLASIRLLVETLTDTDQLDEVKTREYLGLIANENERLSRLIEGFLTFSRLERGMESLFLEPLPLMTVVEDSLKAVEGKRAMLGFTIKLGDKALLSQSVVNVDRNLIVTAILNVIDNAIKYSGESTVVEIHAKREADGVTLCVEDFGIGLSERDCIRAFEKFYRVDQRLARSQEGSGLGLNMVKTIVDKHEGKVWIDSELSVGTRFYLYLPSAKID